MKKILRLRIQNIEPYSFVDRSFDKKGLVRLQGPNGAGKSTLFNLMANTLTNEAPIKRKSSDFAEDTKTEFLLEVTWSFDGKTYVAAIAQKCKLLNPKGEEYGKGIFLFEDGVLLTGHRGPDSLKMIHKYFGASITDWYATAYLAQAQSHGLINGTPGERMTHLSNLFGLEKMDRLHQFYKTKTDALEKQIEELEDYKRRLEINTSQLSAHKTEEEIEVRIAEINASLQGLEENLALLRPLEELYKKCKAAKDSVAQLTPEVIALYNRTDLEEVLSSLETQLSEALSKEMLLTSLQEKLKGLPVYTKVHLTEEQIGFLQAPDIDLNEATAKKNQLEEIKRTLVEVQAPVIPEDMDAILLTPDIDLSATNKLIQTIMSRPPAPAFPQPTAEEIQQLQGKIQSLNIQKGAIDIRLKHLGCGKEQCDTCGTELNVVDRETEKISLTATLNSMVTEIQQLNHSVSSKFAAQTAWNTYLALGPDRTSELPALNAAVATYNKKLQYKNLQTQQALYLKYSEKLNALQELPALDLKIYNYQMKQYVQSVQQMNSAYDANEAVKTDLLNQISGIVVGDLNQIRTDINFTKVHIKARTAYLETLKEIETHGNVTSKAEEISSCEQSKATYATELGFLQSEVKTIKGIRSEIDKLLKSIMDLEHVNREYARCNALKKAYAKDGILRKAQLSRFNKFLSNALLPYTHKLLPNMKFSFQIDDGVSFFAEKLDKPHMKPYDVKTCSGGEKGCLSLALLFAMDDIAPPSKLFNLKIIDEVEAFMDKDRKEDFLHFIVPELRKRAETIILISHTASASAVDFDEIWEVTKDGTVKDVGEAREFATE